MRPALVLLDLQYDFLKSPTLQPAAGELISHAASLLQRCREASVPVIHIWTTVRRGDDRRMPHWKEMDKWICVDGTSGHATPPPLRPQSSEAILHKTFFSAFEDGELEKVLEHLGVDTICLAGVHLHSCIRATALDAYRRGLTVQIVADAVGSYDSLHAAVTRRYLESRVAAFVTTDDLFAALAKPKESTKDQISRATANARMAWLKWRNSPLDARVELLTRIASAIESDAPTLATHIAIEVHKPIRYAQGEVSRAVALIKAAARHADEPLQRKCGEHSILRYRPRGVVAMLTPWNNPIAIPFGKIAPALLYGNAVVWKPSPAAALIANRAADILESAGCPAGLVNVVHGGSATAGHLLADPGIDAVMLTGSVSSGSSAQAICAERHVPLQAELGGNNAAIIWSDTDLEAAAFAVAEGAFGFAGQRCTANRRVIVERACLDGFVKQLERAVSSVCCGDALSPETRVGRMISEKKREQVAALISRTEEAWPVVLRGHSFDDSAFYPPTVVCCDDPRHEVVQEETFGPLMVLQPASDFDHALRLCNGVRYGLVAALFSDDRDRRTRFLDDAQAGILKINSTTADADAEAPFGGWKASGIGPPEHGPSNREVYSRTQAVYIAAK
jgi:acyl-CoA reductase-like NAD-dependent aldehyde dehydrogenase